MKNYIQPDLFNVEEPPKKTTTTKCEHCGCSTSTYVRRFNSGMAVALIALHRYGERKFVHLEELLRLHNFKRCGDFSYMVHYRLIEKMEGLRPDKSKRNAHYRISSLGTMFCEMKTTVKEKFIIKENTLLGFSGEEINIKQALKEKFDYSVLMNL